MVKGYLKAIVHLKFWQGKVRRGLLVQNDWTNRDNDISSMHDPDFFKGEVSDSIRGY